MLAVVVGATSLDVATLLFHLAEEAVANELGRLFRTSVRRRRAPARRRGSYDLGAAGPLAVPSRKSVIPHSRTRLRASRSKAVSNTATAINARVAAMPWRPVNAGNAQPSA